MRYIIVIYFISKCIAKYHVNPFIHGRNKVAREPIVYRKHPKIPKIIEPAYFNMLTWTFK